MHCSKGIDRAARDRLIVTWIGWAIRLARRFRPPHVEPEDAIGEALLALVLAAETPPRGAFSTQAYWMIRGRLSNLGRVTARRLHLEASYRESARPGMDLPSESVEIDLSPLDQRQRATVTLRYGLNGSGCHPFEAIGRSLGVTRQRACQIHLDALALLRHDTGW